MSKNLIKSIKNKIYRRYRDEIEINADIITRIVSTAMLHRQTFLPFKNYCKGQKNIVVCCAGPTLSKYKPIEGAVHIAVNRSFLYEKVDFDFIFAQDFDGIKMVQEQLINYRPGKCIKFLGVQQEEKRIIPESLILKCHALKFETDGYIYDNGLKGSLIVDLDARPICNMVNVGQSVMQLALYMNPKNLYIVGSDMSGNHFAKGNQTDAEEMKQEKELHGFWISERENLLLRWNEIKRFAKLYYPDTRIISVNPVGLKGVFEDLYQAE